MGKQYNLCILCFFRTTQRHSFPNTKIVSSGMKTFSHLVSSELILGRAVTVPNTSAAGLAPSVTLLLLRLFLGEWSTSITDHREQGRVTQNKEIDKPIPRRSLEGQCPASCFKADFPREAVNLYLCFSLLPLPLPPSAHQNAASPRKSSSIFFTPNHGLHFGFQSTVGKYFYVCVLHTMSIFRRSQSFIFYISHLPKFSTDFNQSKYYWIK